MSSFRSRLFVFALKYRHLLQGKLRRVTKIDPETSLQELRRTVEKGADFWGNLPKNFQLVPVNANGVTAEWMLPPQTGRDKVILYFHGGGLVVGSIRAHRAIVAKFVQGSGVGALLFDYGLAPEHPFPDGLNDSIAVYQYLLDEGVKPEKIVFMGDSGGGNLVFATLLALKEKNLPLPVAAVALSPWTDLTNSGDSWEFNAKLDTLCWKEAQRFFADYYAGNHDRTRPLISPVFGDLTGLPPLLIFAGGHETMLSDSVRIAEKARVAGVPVTLTIGAGLFHCYPACAPLFPEATQALHDICEFIRLHIEP